ncbi:MAG: IS91 family transposase [Deltaproteobacteria bacterium HGW-Deltaproteobacteria-15]|nr:MAG: IS91 family transposase [Deltaproteobacteria bacterium HGW-Deltaproteobacteria-15]
MQGRLEVADVFRAHGPDYRNAYKLHARHRRAMRAIEICRTAELGGHKDECDHCGRVRISYNSCRNRHCPKCQGLDRERWLEARKEDILPIHYFHVVFTLPEALRALCLRNQAVAYSILFRAAWETVKELTEDARHLRAEVGLIAVLHTWSQALIDHPHLHCIVTGGGLSMDGRRWVSCKGEFFLPVKVLSRLFRGKFLAHLKEAHQKGRLLFPGKIAHLKEKSAFKGVLRNLYSKEWEVYCKPPFRNAEMVMEYLGRYTHRVAISNGRLIKLESGKVTFLYRDRRDDDRIKPMTLDASEFIRRFLLHVLPDGFVKIRHYGILSNRSRKSKMNQCRRLLGVDCRREKGEKKRESWQDLLTRVTGNDPRICPYCGKGMMVLKEVLNPSALPLAP